MEVPAYAKVNLTLEILGRRDDGYHEVRTILQTIDLADALDISKSPRLQVECDQPELNGRSNLVWKAAASLADRAGVAPQARIRIRKRIPVGMGLGGGSSDAAAALLALDRLWGLDLGREELSRTAAGLGSDVPFFLTGGTALAQGRGEQVASLPALPCLPLTLVCPGTTVANKTAGMYSRLTLAHYSDGGVTRRMVETLAGGQFIAESMPGLVYNAFEDVASQAFPDYDWLRRDLAEMAPGRFRLTGAGPAMFALPSSENEYKRVEQALKPYPVDVYFAHTITPSREAA